MLTIKNTQPGPRGFNAVSGPTLLDPGQSIEAKVYQREKEHLEATGWFEVSGDYEANPDALAAAPPMNDDVVKKQAAEIKALKKQVAASDAKDAEIDDLRKQLAEAKAGPALKAEHHGGGKFNVTRGEEVLLSGLSKADADAFNAMSAEDKATYVEAEKAKG